MNQPEDVEVVLTHDRRFKFHASVLARNSPLLAGMLTELKAARLSKKAKDAGIKVRWMIKLSHPPHGDDPGELQSVELDTMGVPLEPLRPLIINENGRIPTLALDYYEAIFNAFYNREIPLREDDMTTVLHDVVEILKFAEYLDCTAVIRKPIDVALIKHGQELFRSIQSRPWAWVDLAIRIRSETIFKEAIIHLVGNWKRVKDNGSAMRMLQGGSKEVFTLCERLHQDMAAKGKKLELEVATIYPGGMTQPTKNVPIKREEYAKDILVWMALSFFRHWFSQRIISEKGSTNVDGGYGLYTQLQKAGNAYMDRTILNQFHSNVPMTKKAMNVLENHLLEIKACIKQVVDKHDILKIYCQLDTKRFEVNYLTGVDVRKEDFPWYAEELQERPTGKRKRSQSEVPAEKTESEQPSEPNGQADDEKEDESTGSHDEEDGHRHKRKL
ncbi:hypothetical protein BU24DRAFT_386885 [Aaosphaeria arxii CBS 175.79]|uniref:BTB domain-containing protein n=1 Tax=Aaosphaeria arxii CBS 175.79 TaxID=1450172 RepID=A0A6A5Y3E0_9PLEO|nr:uncharacterized protein BU24DRAFT_386885 [Aaosphaeria arxii CBS 175.79]KAF2019776.1 hypothetical protein BU24DRAFT_386885 [Aaosphaeria arxii CBS 175.79]